MVAALLALLACGGRAARDTPGPAGDADSGRTEDTGATDTADSAAHDTSADDTGLDDTGPVGPDADGDGYVDLSAGGDDCDDADAKVHPGTEEWCDAADGNCDGDPYDGAACGKPQDLGVLAAGTWDGDTGLEAQSSGTFVGDLDADGTDDIILLGVSPTTDEEWPSGSSWDALYVPGGQPLAVGTSRHAQATASWHADWWSTPIAAAHRAGDADGDGHPDLWVLANDEYGAAALMLGPPSRWGVDQNFVDVADALWYGEAYRDGFAMATAATDVDFDQDGFPDAAFMSFSDGSGGSDGAIYLVRGGADTVSVRSHSVSDAVSMPCSGKYDIAAGDITGDGIPDLLLGRGIYDEVLIVDGVDLAGADGQDCESLAGSTLVSSVEDTRDTNWGYGVAVVGDWNGDGTSDWVVGDSSRGVDEWWEGAVYAFAGTAEAAVWGTVTAEDEAHFSIVGGAQMARLGYAKPRPVADVSGDGISEIGTSIIVDLGSGDEVAAIIIPSGAYSGLNLPLPDTSLVLRGGDHEHVSYTAPSAGDFDGDGVNDILTGAGYWEDHRGREYLVLGGGIPWDDPTAW